MGVFEKTAKRGDYFYYQVGSVTTKKVWGKPSYEKIKNFLTAIKNETTIMSEFELYLIGGVLFDINKTWDVDICMIGEVKDPNVLESYMNTMYDIALNRFQLLIDIQWDTTKPKIVSYQELLSGSLVLNKIKFYKIGYIKKQINGEVTVNDYRKIDGITKVTDYLVQGFYDEYPGSKNNEKLLNRILSNPNKVIKSFFSVNDFLENNEEFFIKNTNQN